MRAFVRQSADVAFDVMVQSSECPALDKRRMEILYGRALTSIRKKHPNAEGLKLTMRMISEQEWAKLLLLHLGDGESFMNIDLPPVVRQTLGLGPL
jgi:hypothetical protein